MQLDILVRKYCDRLAILLRYIIFGEYCLDVAMYSEVLLQLELSGIDNVWKLENFVSFRIAAFDMKIKRYHFIVMLNYLIQFCLF